MIEHMLNVASDAPSTRSPRERATHPVRARPSRPAASASTPPATTCPRSVGTTLASGHFLDAVSRPLPGGRARRAGGQRRFRSRSVGGHVEVFLGNTWFTVVGIMKPVDARLPHSTRPCSSACRSPSGCSRRQPNPSEIYVRANQNDVTQVSNLLAATADPQNARRRQVSRPSDVLEARAAAKGQFTTLLLGLGAVALLVGAIGIANIMVISVLERRGEIGLRRALGATRRHISSSSWPSRRCSLRSAASPDWSLGAGATAVYAAAKNEPFVVPAVRADRRAGRRLRDRRARRALPRRQGRPAQPDRSLARIGPAYRCKQCANGKLAGDGWAARQPTHAEKGNAYEVHARIKGALAGVLAHLLVCVRLRCRCVACLLRPGDERTCRAGARRDGRRSVHARDLAGDRRSGVEDHANVHVHRQSCQSGGGERRRFRRAGRFPRDGCRAAVAKRRNRHGGRKRRRAAQLRRQARPPDAGEADGARPECLWPLHRDLGLLRLGERRRLPRRPGAAELRCERKCGHDHGRHTLPPRTRAQGHARGGRGRSRDVVHPLSCEPLVDRRFA